jgi:hypothetical protein
MPLVSCLVACKFPKIWTSELGKLHQRQNLENPATKWGRAEVKALTRKICLDGYKNKRIGNKLSQCEKMRECTNISLFGGSFSSLSLENYKCPSRCKIIPQ